jgi:hypothetical protein
MFSSFLERYKYKYGLVSQPKDGEEKTAKLQRIPKEPNPSASLPLHL